MRTNMRPWAALRAQYTYTPKRWKSSAPVISIDKGTFYRRFPRKDVEEPDNPPIFRNLKFTLPSAIFGPQQRPSRDQRLWAIIGPTGTDTTDFLHVLRGGFVCDPSTARSYPFLATDQSKHSTPEKAIRYVGFNSEQSAGGGVHGAYLSARYESRREATDWTVRQFLTGETSLNPLKTDTPAYSEELLAQVIADLRLGHLVDMPVANLSHGQGRRARIARALLDEPELLLLDQPFMGLDPLAANSLSSLLGCLAVHNSPRIVISLRPQDYIPHWINYTVILGPNHSVVCAGRRKAVHGQLLIWNAIFNRPITSAQISENPSITFGQLSPSWIEQKGQLRRLQADRSTAVSRSLSTPVTHPLPKMVKPLLREFSFIHPSKHTAHNKPSNFGEDIVAMHGVHVKYDEKSVLGNWRQFPDSQDEGLFWTVRRGQRWGIFGTNGAGKTTLISLITSDHPQAYSQPILLFGHSRLPEPGQPGISIFDLQSRIGHSSPEVHSFFPRHLSVRAALESAWAETFLSVPKLDDKCNTLVRAFLHYFESDLRPDYVHLTRSAVKLDSLPPPTWADTLTFGALSLPQQKLVLFLRAIIRSPDLVVLDEALASMTPKLRDKCLHFLESGFSAEPSTESASISDWSDWQIPDGQLCDFAGVTFQQSLIVVSHVKEEIPGSLTHWMRLPGSEDAVATPNSNRFETGMFSSHETVMEKGVWEKIWGLPRSTVTGADADDKSVVRKIPVTGADADDKSVVRKLLNSKSIVRKLPVTGADADDKSVVRTIVADADDKPVVREVTNNKSNVRKLSHDYKVMRKYTNNKSIVRKITNDKWLFRPVWP